MRDSRIRCDQSARAHVSDAATADRLLCAVQAAGHCRRTRTTRRNTVRAGQPHDRQALKDGNVGSRTEGMPNVHQMTSALLYLT